jgi:hypothetical protein
MRQRKNKMRHVSTHVALRCKVSVIMMLQHGRRRIVGCGSPACGYSSPAQQEPQAM